LNWLAGKNIVVIPKTINPSRLQENLVFEDFTLDKDDLDRIATLNDGWKIVDPRSDKLKAFFDNLPLFN
jgi:diketogulonate reductase-like aldo/keto reductase